MHRSPEADATLTVLHSAYQQVRPTADAQKTALATSFSNLDGRSALLVGVGGRPMGIKVTGSKTDDRRAARLVSRHGPHLAVGVGPGRRALDADDMCSADIHGVPIEFVRALYLGDRVAFAARLADR